MKGKLVKSLSIAAAGVLAAGVMVVTTNANATVVNCPSFAGRFDLKPWLEFMTITPFSQRTFINAELASSTSTTCRYNGLLLQEAQGASPVTSPATFTFKKTELNSDGTVLRPPFIG